MPIKTPLDFYVVIDALVYMPEHWDLVFKRSSGCDCVFPFNLHSFGVSVSYSVNLHYFGWLECGHSSNWNTCIIHS